MGMRDENTKELKAFQEVEYGRGYQRLQTTERLLSGLIQRTRRTVPNLQHHIAIRAADQPGVMAMGNDGPKRQETLQEESSQQEASEGILWSQKTHEIALYSIVLWETVAVIILGRKLRAIFESQIA
jgi:hypothetical protein